MNAQYILVQCDVVDEFLKIFFLAQLRPILSIAANLRGIKSKNEVKKKLSPDREMDIKECLSAVLAAKIK